MELGAYEIALIGGGFTLLGAIIGGYIGYYFSGQLLSKQEFNKAAAEFRAAFVDEIRVIDSFYSIDIESTSIPNTLANAIEKHEKALMIFKDGFLCETDRTEIQKAWNEYTCHEQPIGGRYSFSDYKNIQKNDSAKLALERINNVLKFAKRK